MILQIQDSGDNITTVVNVMMVEHEEGSNQVKIWDYCDNIATVTAKNESDAERCVRNLYSGGRAQIDARIDWEDN